MGKLWASLSVIYVLLSQSVGVPRGSEVIVRLVYLDSGKPANDQLITLYEGVPSRTSTIRRQQITGKDGVANFRVSIPAPQTVWVDENNGNIKGCAWEDQIPLQEILSTGATVGRDNRFGSSCKGTEDTITRLGAKPGEIVVFVRKVGLGQDLRHY